jgi:hypothetical protein
MTAGFRFRIGGNRNYLRNLRARTTHKGVLRPVGAPQEGSIEFDYINFLSADAFSRSQ